MRESQFVKQHTARWQEFENLSIGRTGTNPDKLADLFIQLTDDLSYARTNYPDSKTTQYLNNLTAKVHQSIYKNRREKSNRLITFWTHELPLVFYSTRKQLLYAFVIFGLATMIGVISTAYDEDFARSFLGDGYINMTIENIKNGDPMAVYKDTSGWAMFLSIPWHNMKVAGFTFLAGVFCFSWYLLVQNGIMLGTFQFFFYKYGLLASSASVIWIHGTLEISCIVIAGCAGLVIGNSILFPGTYARMESFKTGAIRGLKIYLSILPLLLMAGFLESYITRLTDMPLWGKLMIIISSAIFIVWYYIVYPVWVHRKTQINIPKTIKATI
ncbi:MAG: stage II sporulation protein M [Verrucomicrobia bacterium]|nr:stage II sporulation protein M [Cytophagales bacterium]